MPKILGELQSASLENLASDPAGTVTGRIWHNTTEVRVKTDDGTDKRALLRNDSKLVIGNNGTAANNVRANRSGSAVLQILPGDDVTAEGATSTTLAQLDARVANFTTVGTPAAGNVGRVIFDTDLLVAKLDNGTNLRTLLVNDQKIIIGNDGTANNNVRINRAAATTIQLVPGGDTTAEGSLSTSVAQLSSRVENYTTGTRPAAGNAGRVGWNTTTLALEADNGTTIFPVTLLNTASKVANYTLVVTDHIIFGDSSAGTFTLTMYTAVGNAGRVVRLQKTDTTLTPITVNFGAFSTQLNSVAETLEVVSNGTTWVILNRTWQEELGLYTPDTANGLGTVSYDLYRRRSGRHLIIYGNFTVGTISASEARIFFRTAAETVAVSSQVGNAGMVVGFMNTSATNGSAIIPHVTAGNGYMNFSTWESGVGGRLARTGTQAFKTSSTVVGMYATIPIEGWNTIT